MKTKKRINFEPFLKYSSEKFSSYLKTLEDEDFLRHVPQIKRVGPLFDKAFSNPFPKTINSLKKGKLTQYVVGLPTELKWLVRQINILKTEISYFCKLRIEFEIEFLRGNGESAKKVLDSIEEKFGQSIWLIENKISILQEFDGIEKQKLYAAEIYNSETVNGIIRFMTFYFSLKAEPNLPHFKYESIIEKELEKTKENKPLFSYLNHKLRPFSEITDSLSVLAWESDSSIIDKYLTLIKIFSSLFIRAYFDSELFCELKGIIGSISLEIRDPSLDTLRTLLIGTIPSLNNNEDKTANNIFLQTLDSYTKGDYYNAIEFAKILLSKNTFPIETLEVLAKSALRAATIEINFSQNCQLKKIIKSLQEIFLPTDSSGNSFSDLCKTLYVNHNHSWVNRIFITILNEYFSSDSVYQFENPADLAVNSYSGNPQLLLAVKNNEHRDSIISNFNKILPNSLTVRFYSSLSDESLDRTDSFVNTQILDSRKTKYEAHLALRNKNYELAIKCFQCLLNHSDQITKKYAMHGLAKTFILSEKLEQAVETICICYLDNPNFINSVPINDILEKIQNNGIKNFSSTIYFPIIYGIYSKHFSSKNNFQRNEFCERFLSKHELSKPSEFFQKYPEFEKKPLVFFLYSVCQTEVIDSFIVFSSTEEVMQERIQILQQLNEIDPGTTRYFDEIKSITKKIIIGKNLREIEQSKIYVDIERLTTTLEKSLRESFDRFCALRSISSTEIEQNSSLFKILKFMEGISTNIKLSIPSDESLELFKTMFIEIRDRFVSSNEFGLDTYLSVRVRHGTMSGQIRGILESFNLITQKDGVSGTYHSNEYWRKKLSLESTDPNNICSNALVEFSENVDDLVQELIGKRLQISTETKPSEGIFNYSFLYSDFWQMKNKFKELKTYDQFLSFCLGLLWERTDENLVQVRKEISSILKDKFNSAFQTLQNKVFSANLVDKTAEFIASINNARTALQNCLDRISEWFRRSKDTAHGDYEAELLFEICLEMIKNTYPKWNFSADTNLEKGLKLAGKTLLALTDVVFLLLDNVVKHSGLSNKNVKVIIEFKLNDGYLILRLENPFELKPNFHESKEKVAKIKDRLLSQENFETVRKEGGSGFFKVKKLLEVDLGCQTTLDFGFFDDSTFRFEAKFLGSGIIHAFSNH